MAQPYDIEQPASTTDAPVHADSKSEKSMTMEDYQELVKAIRRGDLFTIRKQFTDDKKRDLFTNCSPKGNTILHVAVRYPNWVVVGVILEHLCSKPEEPNQEGETSLPSVDSPLEVCKSEGETPLRSVDSSLRVCESEGGTPLPSVDSPLEVCNSNKETPLHIAAKYGNVVVVFILLVSQDDTKAQELLKLKDKEGNTPLHNAVRHGHQQIAQYFIDCDPSQICEPNEAGQSPLSIAVDAGLKDIARSMFRILRQNKESEKEDAKEPESLTLVLRSAIIRQNYEIVVGILKYKPGVIDTFIKQDNKGRNPLHYAAASGHVKIAQSLCEVNASLVNQPDNKGQTPLHLAAMNGRENLLKVLLKDYPDAIEFIDSQKRNILHVAAQNGDVKIVSFILKLPEMVDLVNSTDKDGNTPLHLAAMEFHNDVVYIFSTYMTVNIRATNKKNQTALEIVESSAAIEGKDIQKHLTTKALKAAYADRGLYAEDILEDRAKVIQSDGASKEPEGIQQQESKRSVGTDVIDGEDGKGKEMAQTLSVMNTLIATLGDGGKGKEMAQTLSVMNTLIATFTFTAAFTIPGGFRSEGQDEGMAILVRRTSFQAFVIIDTIAMTSSMTAAVIVFWSFWCSKSEFFMDSLPLAIALTWIGLVSMTLAFVTGLYVVLSDNMALAITVSTLGCALPLIFYVLAPFILLLSGQSANVNPFAFSFSMVKIVLNKPINWCVRFLSKRKFCSSRVASTTTIRFAFSLVHKLLFGLIFYMMKALLIALSNWCFRGGKRSA